MKKNKGFSLIELMVVVLIIGVIAAMGFPMYTKFKSSTESEAIEQTLRSLRNAALTVDASGTTLADGQASKLEDYVQSVSSTEYYLGYNSDTVWCVYYQKGLATAATATQAGVKDKSGCINQDGGVTLSTSATTGKCSAAGVCA